ncbi:hypothetical protein C348_01165 [Cryptococcus neoformans Gb118]|nr:hypothetical protein C350_01189 [Cryptococcus neoformans var. grubii MW-RSA36]OXL10762.1 hypothetical protein C348_01165 [Cryptococcus neoformans var. grubii Gb118]
MPFPPSMPVGQQPLSIPPSSDVAQQAFGFNSTGNSFPRQNSFGMQPQGGPSRWDLASQSAQGLGQTNGNAGMVSGLSALMRSRGTDVELNSSPPGGTHSSLSSNPHAGFHPSSYGPNIGFTAFALGSSAQGAGSYLGTSNLGMSISPPNWGSLGSGSFVGSMGAFGTSLNREREGRERELEARYVKDFSCCGKRLNGLHELLEHYEEEHANMAPNVRIAALNAAQGVNNSPRTVGNPFSAIPPTPVPLVPQQSQTPQVAATSDAPQPPGMMDIEMEDSAVYSQPINMSQIQQPPQFGVRTPGLSGPPSGTNPWAAAFRPQLLATPPQCVPPSLLSYAPPTSGIASGPSIPSSAPSPAPLTPEQQAAKAERKARKRAERAAKDEGSASETEGAAVAGEKRFPCPIEGCGKVYKQANGLKYHLTRSINSGHGTIPPGGLAALLGEKGGEVEG